MRGKNARNGFKKWGAKIKRSFEIGDNEGVGAPIFREEQGLQVAFWEA
jgi:hypothetical protein